MTLFYDIECFRNYFLAAFIDKQGNKYSFELSPIKNQIHELLRFYDGKRLIGYNVLEYDAQVMEWIMEHPDCSNIDIFNQSQRVVNSMRPDKWEYQLRNEYLDLMQIGHWGINSAKTASLKWLQFSTNQDILDLPYHWNDELTLEQMEEVKDYCINSDIPSTIRVYELCRPQIDIRLKISKDESINVRNAPEPKMAKKLFSKHLREDMDLSYEGFSKLSTEDESFRAEEVILPYIKFQDPLFNRILHDFKQIKIEAGGKTELKKKYVWKGLEIVTGLGGLHACRNSAIWETDGECEIIDSDAVSFYPTILIRNNKYPRHLGEAFITRYNQYFEERKKISKKDPANYVRKIVLNSTFGKLLDVRDKMLFDRRCGMFITLNGQLLLLMLVERLSECGDILTINTDGITSKVRKDKKERYFELCKEWETITKLELEHASYKKYISYDVNNYIVLTDKGESKCKGRFEFEPFFKFDTNCLHKNRSQLIVPYAIHEFFVKGIPIEETILNHKNIFDFCLGDRSKGSAWFESLTVEGENVKREKLPKTIRYYMTDYGTIFKKLMPDKDKDKVNESYLVCHPKKGSQYKMKLFNKVELKPIEEYRLDYNYYLKEARKEIDIFQLNQISLL